MIRPVLLTGDIFRQQPRGGITRTFIEVASRLERPATIVLGAHVSQEVDDAPVHRSFALRVPRVRGIVRLLRGLNARVDAWAFARSPDAIIHPTYYRDPRGLPARAKVVATVFDMTHERFPGLLRDPRDPARHKAALCRRADRVICISQATRRDAIERLGLPEEKVRVALLAGRDWTTVEPRPIPALPAPFLLWVGARHPYKNFLPTLEAWVACPAATGTALLCVGGGPFRAHELQAIEALRAHGRVIQRDCGVGELRWAYEQALALAYTSLWEGFGVPLVEALGLGCPVVASDIEPLREVGGDQAIYVVPTERDSMAAGLARALALPRDGEHVTRRRAHAAGFSWVACAAVHETVYGELG